MLAEQLSRLINPCLEPFAPVLYPGTHHINPIDVYTPTEAIHPLVLDRRLGVIEVITPPLTIIDVRPISAEQRIDRLKTFGYTLGRQR